ncbi:MAG: phosphatidate cytidylyltransferase, partial [Candidatus Limnocylindrales bacterium]
MRERAISAAVLVPVLLLILAIGGPVIGAAVALATALAALEVFRLLRSAGYVTFSALGTALALVVVLDAAFPGVLEGSGLLLGAVGIVLVAVASLSRPDPRDGLAIWMATIFGALYVSLLSFVIRLGHAAPALPGDAP